MPLPAGQPVLPISVERLGGPVGSCWAGRFLCYGGGGGGGRLWGAVATGRGRQGGGVCVSVGAPIKASVAAAAADGQSSPVVSACRPV